MDVLAKQVGARLRELRAAQGMTLDQLSETSGLPPESINRIENGRRTASLRSLVRLAKGLGVGLADVIGAAGDPPPTAADGLPMRVRGIALRMCEADERTLQRIVRIVDVLLEP